ncbi:MAG: hypothetical protein VX255_21785 [Candidatus Latescibacterota bacterium]|nr:hypothetical protein [Candidatus Latescibacterota bacterium]
MALGLSYRCACGERFKVYLPKGMVYGETVSRAVDWDAVDAREEADGEVDELQRVAESTGCTFIDGRKTPHLACPSCTSELDLVDHFRTRLLAV